MSNIKKENLAKIAEELIWYGGKSPDGRWEIFICVDFDYTLTCKGSWTTGKFVENPVVLKYLISGLRNLTANMS